VSGGGSGEVQVGGVVEDWPCWGGGGGGGADQRGGAGRGAGCGAGRGARGGARGRLGRGAVVDGVVNADGGGLDGAVDPGSGVAAGLRWGGVVRRDGGGGYDVGVDDPKPNPLPGLKLDPINVPLLVGVLPEAPPDPLGVSLLLVLDAVLLVAEVAEGGPVLVAPVL